MIVAGSLIWLASAASAVSPDLLAAVHAYDAAQVQGDRAALERLVAPDYLLVNSSGKVETKADLIRDYTAPGFRLDPFKVEQEVRQTWPGGAVFGGIAEISGVESGKPYRLRLRFADVWARRDGKWQVVYSQVARAPE
jgi:hypothetical protein